MPLSKKYLFLAYNSVAALAGAAAIFVLVDPVAVVTPPNDDVRAIARAAAPPTPLRGDRFAFVEPRALLEAAAPSADVALMPSIAEEVSIPTDWSTNVRPELTAPPSGPSGFRLPWQAANPGTLRHAYTLKARLAEVSPGATARLAEKFAAAKAPWPPTEIALIGFKDEKKLELYARSGGDTWTLIHRYRILAASGGAGPKLRKGDRQVPEGVYRIAFLNPSSAYHLSLAVNYPNPFDRQMAAKDGRKDLGGDIMIHGKNLSAGCLAMGDEAIEELFVLAAQTGLSNVKLIIAPTDFRQNGLPTANAGGIAWVPKLYTEIASALSEFKAPRSTGLLSFFTK